MTWTQPTLSDDELEILRYVIYWDEGYRSYGNYTILDAVPSYDQVSYNLTAGLKTGHTYRFTVKAVNLVGYGPDSAIAEVIAASKPAQMDAPVRTTSQ